MKKWLSIFIICVVFTTYLTDVIASEQRDNIQSGFMIEFNGEYSDYSGVISDNTHYVPLRRVFEKMGSVIFYRKRDRQILALTRDGDIICHNVGSNSIIINGELKVFENPSILENNEAYISIEMLTAALCPDGISYDNQKLNIQKQIFNNEYHIVIKDVLALCQNSNFYPERFQRYINYHIKNPAYSMQEVIFRVNLGLDYPFYENIKTIEEPYELLVLVNKYNQLPTDFKQYNLVNMSREYTVNDGKEYLLAATAYEKYIQMSEAAKKDGLSLRVVSAYRTEAYQRSLYINKLNKSGKVYADNYSARPGHSEHQTGLAVDISCTKVSFENTSEFKWLHNHAHEYGYILRYPKGKEWITGYAYEPWHYRYVGSDAAGIIREEGITYEEYYAKYVSVNEFM